MFPEGCIKLGPDTAPIVDPHTTKESCLARVLSVARSIAAKRAWYPAADAEPTKNAPIKSSTTLLSAPPVIAIIEPMAPVV